MRSTATGTNLRQNPRNNPRTEEELIHVPRRYRPAGCWNRSNPEIGEIQTRLLEAHGKAVEALKAEFCARLETLADEAQQIYNAAPEAARLHPRRLPDRNLEIGVERERGVELAAAFGMTLGYVFWHALTPEAYEGIVAKQRIGRSAPHESWTRDRTDPFAAHDPESRMGMT